MRTANPSSNLASGLRVLVVALLTTSALYLTASQNFLLVHTVVEGFAVVVALLTFILATRSYQGSGNSFLLYLGNAYLFVAVLDLLHLMTYEGMGIFPGYGADVAAQLWIAGRYVEAASLFLSTFFFRRSFPRSVVFWLYALATAAFVVSIMVLRLFPACFIEGQGLTRFKIGSEYFVVLLVLGAFLRLRSHRAWVERSSYLLLAGAMVTMILSELSLTFYSDTFGMMTLVGHLFEVLSHYFIYSGIVLRCIEAPYEEIRRLNEGLEKRIADRTAQLEMTNRELAEQMIEHQRAEETLRKSEELHRTLVEAVDDIIHVKDAQGRYVLVNSAMSRRLGLSKEEILGKTALQLYEPEMSHRAMEEDLRVLRSGEVVDVEKVMGKGQGERIVHVRKVPLRSETGEVVGVVTVGRDITERKQMEERLLRAQRLETAGRIAGQVAHDFNNLLSPLVAYSELIRMELPEGHPAGQYCDVMGEAARRMAEINGDLLALGRRGLIEHKPTDLNRLASQALLQMADRSETLVVETDLDPDLLPVAGSSGQLLRVILNLLSNGREAMADAGVLAIKTENVYVEKPIGRHDRVEPGEYVRLTISDTGCGVPAEIRDRIFDPFFSTKAVDGRRGSGLGLSVVQAIVEDHRGYLDLESKMGAGTVFSVWLPVCREEVNEPPCDDTKGGAETVLLVDNDPLQREVVGRMLSMLGYRVEVAASGEEAISRLRQCPADLLILDMVMPPGMDGAETYRQLLKVRPDQRAIVLSGFAESERVQLARTLGVGAYVRKPVTVQELARAVRGELDRVDRYI